MYGSGCGFGRSCNLCVVLVIFVLLVIVLGTINF